MCLIGQSHLRVDQVVRWLSAIFYTYLRYTKKVSLGAKLGLWEITMYNMSWSKIKGGKPRNVRQFSVACLTISWVYAWVGKSILPTAWHVRRFQPTVFIYIHVRRCLLILQPNWLDCDCDNKQGCRRPASRLFNQNSCKRPVMTAQLCSKHFQWRPINLFSVSVYDFFCNVIL